MTRRDLRTAERDWRATDHRVSRGTRTRPVRQPLTLGRMLERLLSWLG